MAKRDWVVVKVPYGGGYCSLNLAKPKGTKYAPDALQKEFERQSIFMADNGNTKKPEWFNLGALQTNSREAWVMMNKWVCSLSQNFMHENNMLFLGGSHTITYSTFSALRQVYGQEVGLVVLDAHPDCCNKADWPIHSDWLAKLIFDKERGYRVFPPNILLLGVRQIEPAELEFMKKHGITYYPISRLGDPKYAFTGSWSLSIELERLAKLEATYVSVDIDVVSGAYAPGTGCPSPGGLTDTEVIGLVKLLKGKLRNLRAIDIVEIEPLNWWRKKILRYDATVDLGVKLIKEIVS